MVSDTNWCLSDVFTASNNSWDLPGVFMIKDTNLSYSVVFLCACVCAFILFHRKGFFHLQQCLRHTWGYGSTIVKMSYFTSKDETEKLERIRYDIAPTIDDIYWYKI